MFKKRLSRAHEAVFNRIVRRTFLWPMTVMVVASISLAWLVSHLLGLTNWVDHTDRVIAEARNCEKLAVDMENGMRGFLVTGDPLLMQPFNETELQMSVELDQLGRQVTDNPFQAERVETIRTAFNKWEAYAEEMLSRRQRGEDYQSIALNAQGKALMDTVRNEFTSFVKDEYILRDARIDAVQSIDRTIRRSRWFVLVLAGATIALYVRRQLNEVATLYESALITAEEKTEALKTAEAQLRQYNENLEEVVAQRTARLQEIVTELEAYSYSISHDLRAPLRAMQGYAQVVQEDFEERLTPQAKVYLDRIIQASNRMDKLIQDVLSYSSVARSELKSERLDLEKLVRTIVYEYPSLNKLRDQIEIVTPLPHVTAPESLLSQCISNLLNNATKFVSDGTLPRIRIRAETSGDDVRIWIEDNGIGIAPEYHKRIFGVFERIPGNKIYEGTGIGLAIVRRAAERMGGTVGVESEPGKGSRFWISLPARKA